MELFATLGVALGLAMLAGINLYLTIFITGLAVKFDWLQDSALATALEGFGHPAVIAVSLGLFLVQFLADKVPWVDSLWDSIHTFLKPAGGVLLALTSLGDGAGPIAQVFVAMIALSGSLLTHWVKAGTRLTLNTSPEPFSNIGASVAEDLLVIGGYSLLVYHPAIALFVFAAAFAACAYLTPRVTRAIRATLWLIWRKLRVPAGDKGSKRKALPNKLGGDDTALLHEEFGSDDFHVVWCLSCVTGKTRHTGQLCRNLFGELVAIREHPDHLIFIGRRNFKKFVERIELAGAIATHESGFLSEDLLIHQKQSRLHVNLRFQRGLGEVTERLADFVQERVSSTTDDQADEKAEEEGMKGEENETSAAPVAGDEGATPAPEIGSEAQSEAQSEADMDTGSSEETGKDSDSEKDQQPAARTSVFSGLSPLGALPSTTDPPPAPGEDPDVHRPDTSPDRPKD